MSLTWNSRDGLPGRAFLLHFVKTYNYTTILDVMNTDDSMVNRKGLARSLGVSTSTTYNWHKQGYRFLYGHWTTPGHAKAWLAERAKTPRPISAAEARRRSVLARLR